jgi:anti-sigma regulatory factor (Ser/Thr protein kinase)
VIEPVVQTLTYASAGHPSPYLRTADGEIVALRAEGLPLGLRSARDAVAATLTLERDSLLVFYTDGLIEATRDVAEGEALLQAAIATLDARATKRPALAIHDGVLGTGSSGDDVAILTVTVVDDPIAARWSFDARDPSAAREGRSAFVATLHEGGYPDERLAVAETIFGELIGNAVRYAPGPIDVLLAWDDRHPVLHVLDRGPGFQFVAKLPSDLYSENGRGLFLITALAEAFHVTRRLEGGSHARVVLRPPTPLFADQATR